MPLDEHLQETIQDLSAQRKLLRELINRLRDDLTLAPTLSEKQPFEVKLERAQADLNALDQKITDLGAKRLENALLPLDHHDHKKAFREGLKTSKAGAFLIHGQYEYGHCWLLQHLLTLLQGNTRPKKLRVGLNSPLYAARPEAIWKEVGRWVNCEDTQGVNEAFKEKTIQSLLAGWETQNQVLILYGVNYLPKAYQATLIQDFLERLLKKAAGCPPSNYYLLVFLMDYSDDFFNLCQAQHTGASGGYTPVILPSLVPLSLDDLQPWFAYHDYLLPQEVQDDPETYIETILKETQGVPMLVADALYALCGNDPPSEGDERWLNL